MPNRIIKESVCGSETVDALSWFEEVFFYRLIVNCDDYGRMDARPAILRSRLFPLKSVTDKQVVSALQSLRSVGIVDLYEVDGRPFLQIRTWERHQIIRAKKSRYPSPDSGVKSSESICKQMHANVPVIQSESEYNNTHTKSAPARVSEEAEEQEETLSLPDEAEIAAEFRKLKLKEPEAEAKAFAEYNSRNGWKGDWKLKAELWARRATKNAYNVARTKEKNEKSSLDVDAFFKAACEATYRRFEKNGGGEIGKKET